MIEIERMGVPAVPIISGRFEGDAIASSRAFGMPGLRFVIVPRIYRNLSPEESVSNTEPAFDELVRMVRPVGVIAFALWTDLYEEVGFEAKQDELERRGELEAYRALGAFRREP